jgi:hypothetical protein
MGSRIRPIFRAHVEGVAPGSFLSRSVSMSDQPSLQGPGPSRRFHPEVKPLESRLLLSRQVSFPDGTSFIFPTFLRLPRTGGVSEQSGTVLGIGVGQSKTNNVHVTDDGQGGIQAEWNGGPVHSFTGIRSSVIQTERSRSNQITFNLTGSRTGPTAVAVGSHVPTDAVLPSEGAHPHNTHVVSVRRTSGIAVQSGSVLTVTVNRPRTNTVAISNGGGGAVAVEWNGGAAHSFAGIATIVVDTRNAGKDLVALHDVIS